MDLILNFFDKHLLTPYVYPSTWPETNIWRQFVSLYFIATISAYFLYLSVAALSYKFIFDKRLMKHPLFLKNQISRELLLACSSIPIMGVLTTLIFVLEVRGYSKLYDDVGSSKFGIWIIPLSMTSFLLFTDCFIYWIHRFLHTGVLYRRIHKPHHTWKVPTPFASHAFHPIDGFLQSVPYHIYVFLFPLHKITYLGLFLIVNVWTVSIHDGDYRVPALLRPVINGSAHHMDHHLFYNYNYGQYFTLWDRIGKSFRIPSSFEGHGPLDDILKGSCVSNKMK